MKLLLLLIVIITTATVVQAGGSGSCDDHWDYKKCGPSTWGTRKEAFCDGHMQSPINFSNDDVIMADLGELNFKNYNSPAKKMTLLNNGHSAKLTVKATNMPMLTGGGLGAGVVFVLAQLHFHWGSTSDKGSEHLIDSEAFPIEMHLVHYNKKFGTLARAVASGTPDALAVVGVMFEKSESDNKYLQPIVEGLSHIKSTDDTRDTNSFALINLVPKDHSSFYRYAGSLTTPTCNQIVTWTVMEHKLKISAEQLKAFRQIRDSHNKPIQDNFRPVQPVNGRSILRNSKGMHGGAQSNVVASTFTVLATLTFLYRL